VSVRERVAAFIQVMCVAFIVGAQTSAGWGFVASAIGFYVSFLVDIALERAS
jgi:phosphotransferase system  glucose/maltose/N-acetylglucosamine-specific IIC component